MITGILKRLEWMEWKSPKCAWDEGFNSALKLAIEVVKEEAAEQDTGIPRLPELDTAGAATDALYGQLDLREASEDELDHWWDQVKQIPFGEEAANG